MRGFRFKPNQKKTEVNRLDAIDIDFLCNIGIINKMIAERTGLSWNQKKQDDFDAAVTVYFLVKKNFEYDVYFGKDFDDFLETHGISVTGQITEKGKKCIEHFIKSL